MQDGLLSQRIRTKDVVKEAIQLVENDGVVIIDEIDKVASSHKDRRQSSSADASSEGVQRDLLPLIEGTTVSTPYGPVNTDHILFICSGAFHSVKPSDLLPELQGRLPIRVELQALTEEDFWRILTVPQNNLVKQQIALLATEDVELTFSEEAVREVARVAAEVNRTVENIGARRLNTVISRIMDEYSFSAADQPSGTKYHIDLKYVQDKIKPLMSSTDLSKFVL
jgi:ATP-dependent HslUV protease ATP-binding subunit HslU